MKIKAVKMMRNIRNQMSNDIKGMTFDEEKEYLRHRIKSFEFLVKEVPNKSIEATETAEDAGFCASC
jgi:hypothetical protein